MKAFKKLLILGAAGLTFSSLTVYAQDLSDIATQGYFYLWTQPAVLLCGDAALVCADPSGSNIVSNLFTFTHPPTPQGARIIGWNVVSTRNGKHATGLFTIEKDCDSCLFGGPILGKIYVEFDVKVKDVPPVVEFEEETEHTNFKGRFKIVGGDGFYDGIKGSGTINGTFRGHEYLPWDGTLPIGDAAVNFVMLGDAKVRDYDDDDAATGGMGLQTFANNESVAVKHNGQLVSFPDVCKTPPPPGGPIPIPYPNFASSSDLKSGSKKVKGGGKMVIVKTGFSMSEGDESGVAYELGVFDRAGRKVQLLQSTLIQLKDGTYCGVCIDEGLITAILKLQVVKAIE